ncbi:hypothetical protein [Catenuloplanes nepalensis]|uniref:hypothetical protein n=1 Tax=Catenuloplanes nepalensis TaxID=587533 RepID=UPI0027D818DE|nr:hypothetical protein [Catenuloplanes nepalensis]
MTSFNVKADVDDTAAAPRSRCWDGSPESDADRRFFDLRESGYTGWIDQDGYPVEDPFAHAGADAASWSPALLDDETDEV